MSRSPRPGSGGRSSWSGRPATTRRPMASCSIWPVAASVTSRCCAIRGERHRSRPSRPTPIDEEAAEDDADPVGADSAPIQPGPALEAADVELGLRYLTDFAVVVLAEPADPQTIAVVADAARWGEARMILVLERRPDGPRWAARRGDGLRVAHDPILTAHSRTSWARSPRRSTRGPSRARRFAARSRQTGGPRPAAPDSVRGGAIGAISSGPSRRTSLTKRSTA